MQLGNQSFYDLFEQQIGENVLSFVRDGKEVFKTKGLVTGENNLLLPPQEDVNIKPNDIVSDGYNTASVKFIKQISGKDTCWEITTERVKKEIPQTSIVNNVSNGNVNQNVGDYGNITYQHQISYSVNDLYDCIKNVETKDQKELLDLISSYKEATKENVQPKKGFLAKFDGLIAKYPNISKILSGLLLQIATQI